MAFSVVQASDSGPGGIQLSVVGSPAVVASDFSGFGNKVTFPNATNSRLRTANSTPFNLGLLSAFTIEVKVPATAASGQRDICGVWGSSGNRWIMVRTGQSLQFTWLDSTNTQRNRVVNSVLGSDASVGVDYDGTTIRIYVDGAVVDSLTGAAATFTTSSYSGIDFFVGQRTGSTSTGAVDGLDEVRVSSVARYAGAYTPDTSPFVSDANTIALYHLDSLDSAVGGFVEELTPGTTSWDVPSAVTHGFNVTSVDIQCTAPGAQGGTSGILNSGGGGGGGAFSQLNDHPVTPGETIATQIPTSPGANTDHTWFRNTSTCLADRGNNGASTSGLGGAGAGGQGGQASTSVGDIKFSGGDGNAGGVLGTQGQGGGSAGESADGQDGADGGLGGASDGGQGGTQGIGGRDPGYPGGGGAGGGQAGEDGRILLRYIRRYVTVSAAYQDMAAELARMITRTNCAAICALEASMARTIERSSSAAESVDAEVVSRVITRESFSSVSMDVLVRRTIERVGAASIEFDAITKRIIARSSAAQEQIDASIVSREITRKSDGEHQLDADISSRTITRASTAKEDLDAVTFRRAFTRRSVASEALDADVNSRVIERNSVAAEQLEVALSRTIARATAAAEELDAAINSRSIARASAAIQELDAALRRYITRSSTASELLESSYSLALRRADFDKFNRLRSILLQHGHEWLNEHFGPPLLDILQSINETSEESGNHE